MVELELGSAAQGRSSPRRRLRSSARSAGRWTWRIDGAEHFDELMRAGRPPILAFWHGRILPATLYWRDRGIVAMTSQNFDGEWIARHHGAVRLSAPRAARPRAAARERWCSCGASWRAAGRPSRSPSTVRAGRPGSRSPARCGWPARPAIPCCPFTSRPVATGRRAAGIAAMIPKPFSHGRGRDRRTVRRARHHRRDRRAEPHGAGDPAVVACSVSARAC